MTSHPWIAAVLLASTFLVPGAFAQQPAKAFGSLEELRAAYSKQLLDLDRRRIADLTALASKLAGDEAEEAYRELFHLAVARELYSEAEPAAARYLKNGSADPRGRALATFVVLIAEANRGEFDRSLADLQAFLARHPIAAEPEKRLDPAEVVAIGEAYLQRLVRGGRFDIARKVCNLGMTHPDPGVKAHFQSRLARLDRVGKPAPEISGRDVDGKPVRLSDFKGKVVLIDFWATWCPPCVASIPELKALDARYGPQGFEILGVNLDAQHQSMGDVAKAGPMVRDFLLKSRAAWPNILVGPGAKDDPAAIYGVEEIPANFLVDRQGKIIRIELNGPDLEKAIAEALGAKK